QPPRGSPGLALVFRDHQVYGASRPAADRYAYEKQPQASIAVAADGGIPQFPHVALKMPLRGFAGDEHALRTPRSLRRGEDRGINGNVGCAFAAAAVPERPQPPSRNLRRGGAVNRSCGAVGKELL